MNCQYCLTGRGTEYFPSHDSQMNEGDLLNRPTVMNNNIFDFDSITVIWSLKITVQS